MPARTIVFIHGMYMTPLCWEHWVPWFEKKGYRCIAPAWPGRDASPQALSRGPPGCRAGRPHPAECRRSPRRDHQEDGREARSHRAFHGSAGRPAPAPERRRIRGRGHRHRPAVRRNHSPVVFPEVQLAAHHAIQTAGRARADDAEALRATRSSTRCPRRSSRPSSIVTSCRNRAASRGSPSGALRGSISRLRTRRSCSSPEVEDHIIPASLNQANCQPVLGQRLGHVLQGIPGPHALHHRAGELAGGGAVRGRLAGAEPAERPPRVLDTPGDARYLFDGSMNMRTSILSRPLSAPPGCLLDASSLETRSHRAVGRLRPDPGQQARAGLHCIRRRRGDHCHYRGQPSSGGSIRGTV